MSAEPTGAKVRKTKPIRRVRNRVIAKVKDVEERARHSNLKRTRATLYVWRLCAQVFRQWRLDRCPQTAASLSYQLLLSLVPALAVVLAAFRATGAMGAESTLVEFLTTELLPLSPEEVSSKLLSWSENIHFETMGLIGLSTMLLIAFVTFNSMEASINHIWRVEKRRSLPKRLATFYLTASLGPLVFGLSLYQAAQFGLTDGWSGAFLSALLSYVGLFMANYFLPAGPVRISAALVGALVNTVAFELAKLAFAAYVGTFAMDKYAGIYGALAVVPLCLIWIYWSWLMFLLGIEVTHIVQNYHLLESGERRNTIGLANELQSQINPYMATQIMVAIASAQAAGESGRSRFRLGSDFSLSDDAVRALIRRLQAAGLVREPTRDDNWSLARDAADISVLDVFDVFRGPQELRIPETLGNSSAGRVLSGILEDSREPLRECSLDDVVVALLAANIE